MLLITPSERAALQLLADGEPATEVAGRLGIREGEIDVYLKMLFSKMGAVSRSDAVANAIRRGLVADGALSSNAAQGRSSSATR